MPLMVPWIQVAPARTAATEHAVPNPKSLCPCQWMGTPSPTQRFTSATRKSTASGPQTPIVSTTTSSAAPASSAAR